VQEVEWEGDRTSKTFKAGDRTRLYQSEGEGAIVCFVFLQSVSGASPCEERGFAGCATVG